MSDLLNPTAERQPERKSASHGEAGYERRPLDAYFTEPWVTRALIAAVDFRLPGYPEAVIWEPACGDGRMAKPLLAAGYRVHASDIADWGYGKPGVDFLHGPFLSGIGAVVTNPPFDQAVAFIERALEATQVLCGKVAILQRHEFDAPAKNHPLFNGHPDEGPFAAKLILHKRPRWSDEDKASPRFPYAWYIFDWRHQGPPILRYLPDPDKPAKATGVLL